MSNPNHEQLKNAQNEQNNLLNDHKIKADLLYWKCGKKLKTTTDDNNRLVINVLTNNKIAAEIPLNLSEELLLNIEPDPLYYDDNLLVYENTDCYNNDNIHFAFKDDSGKWHNGGFGQALIQHNGNDGVEESPYNSEKDIHQYISKLKSNGHLIDDDGSIFYRDEKGKTIDTGFKRKDPASHLNASEIYSDSFTMRKANENFTGDDFYSQQGISHNTLYQRQKDGSYKAVLETQGQAIIKADFADNIYFTGGSIRHPQKEKYVVLGETSADKLQKCQLELVKPSSEKPSLKAKDKEYT